MIVPLEPQQHLPGKQPYPVKDNLRMLFGKSLTAAWAGTQS